MQGTVTFLPASVLTLVGGLRRLPDPVLRWLAAGSIGLSVGFRLAGAPRLAVAAGVAWTLLIGATILLRRDVVPQQP